jgi:hypothetical protein
MRGGEEAFLFGLPAKKKMANFAQNNEAQMSIISYL